MGASSPPPTLVVLDCETTGLDPSRERGGEVGALRLDGGLRPVDRVSALIDPERPLPLAVTRLTGITQADLDEAPPFAEVWPALPSFVGAAVIVGHNVAFDLDFLAAEAARCGQAPLRNRSLDTLDAALLLYPELARHGLSVLAAQLGIEAPNHRARRDAEAIPTAATVAGARPTL